jgi:hypothetical protein
MECVIETKASTILQLDWGRHNNEIEPQGRRIVDAKVILSIPEGIEHESQLRD